MRSINPTIPAQDIEGYLFATCHTGALVEICTNCSNGTRPEYHHVLNGVCFRCGGTGIRHHAGRETKAYATAEEARKAMKTRNREKARAAAKREAEEAERQAERRAAAAAQEAREAAEKAAAAARHQAQQHFGQPGEKITATGTIDRIIYLPGDWNRSSSNLIAVTVDDAGSQIVMFTAAAWAWEAEEGEQVTLSGTVKKHDEWNSTKQTTITRPRRIN